MELDEEKVGGLLRYPFHETLDENIGMWVLIISNYMRCKVPKGFRLV